MKRKLHLILTLLLCVCCLKSWAAYKLEQQVFATDLSDGMYIAIGNSQYVTPSSHAEYPTNSMQGLLTTTSITGASWWGTGLNVIVPKGGVNDNFIWKIEAAPAIDGKTAFYFQNKASGQYIGGTLLNVSMVDSKDNALAFYAEDVAGWDHYNASYFFGTATNLRTTEGYFGPVYNYGGAAYIDNENTTLKNVIYSVVEDVDLKYVELGKTITKSQDLADGMRIVIGNSQYYTDYSKTFPTYPTRKRQGYITADKKVSGAWWGTGFEMTSPLGGSVTSKYVWKLESATPINGKPAFYFKNEYSGEYIGGAEDNLEMVSSKDDALSFYATEVDEVPEYKADYGDVPTIRFVSASNLYFGPVYNYGAGYVDDGSCYSIIYSIKDKFMKRITPDVPLKDGMCIAIGNVQCVYTAYSSAHPDFPTKENQGFMKDALGTSIGAFKWGNGLAVTVPTTFDKNEYFWKLESAGVINGNESWYMKNMRTNRYIGGTVSDINTVVNKEDALAFYRTDVTFNNGYANGDYFDSSDKSDANKLIRFRVYNPDGTDYFFGPGYDYGGAGMREGDNQTLYSMVYVVENVKETDITRVHYNELCDGMVIAIGNVQVVSDKSYPEANLREQGFVNTDYINSNAWWKEGLKVRVPEKLDNQYGWRLVEAGQDAKGHNLFNFRNVATDTYIGGTVNKIEMVDAVEDAMKIYATEASCTSYANAEYYEKDNLISFRVYNPDGTDYYFGPIYNYGGAACLSGANSTMYSMVYKMSHVTNPYLDALSDYSDIIPNGDPGYYNKSLTQTYSDAYNEAIAAADNSSLPAAEKRAKVEAAKSAYQAMVSGEINPITEGYYFITSAGNGSGYNGGPYDYEDKNALYNDGGNLKWKAYDRNDASELYYLTETDGGWFAYNVADKTYINRGTSSYNCKVTTSEEATSAQVFAPVVSGNGKYTMTWVGNANMYGLANGHNGSANASGNVGVWGTATEAKKYGINQWFLHKATEAEINVLTTDVEVVDGVATITTSGTLTAVAYAAALGKVDVASITSLDLRSTGISVATLNPSQIKNAELGLGANTVYYLPTGYSASMPNFVIDGNCVQLILTDKESFAPASGFTVSNAIYWKSGLDGAGWYSAVLPFDVVIPEGMQVLGNATVSNSSISFEEITAGTTISAGTPFIYKTAEHAVNFSTDNVTIPDNATPSTSGALKGTYTKIPKGSATGKLILNAAGSAFATATANASIPAFRAYIDGAVGSGTFTITINDDLTGVVGADADLNAKVDVYSVDGKLVRQGVEAITALQGLESGIYIINGKTIKK